MSIKINKSLMLNEIKTHFKLKSDADFARFLGIKPQTLSSWYSRNTFDIDILYAKCVGISGDWLITGIEPMLKKDHETKAEYVIAESGTSYGKTPIPLVSQKAIGGFGNNDFAIAERDVKEYYVIPKFKSKRIDFMIEVEGSSMYPKYNSGDVVACTIIRESKFIQWNKTHVIATKEQGIIIKRIKKGKDEDHLCMISDNESYDPFNVPVEEITGIALVAGVIRLE